MLKVKDDLAGKRGKCPACGESVSAPAPHPTGAPLVRHPNMPTSMPTANVAEPSGEHPTVPPGASAKAAESSESETLPPAPGAAHASEHASELVDFLAPPQAPDELGRLGPYRVLKVLGHGGMGVVYLAEDPQLQRKVALKAMLPALAPSKSARERFLREARAAAAIKHDHIVTIFQVGEDRGAPFLAMEFLEGESLDDRLKRAAPLPGQEILRIGRQVAEGLEAAHAQAMIHRDIKPGNIWLETVARRSSESGYRVKILDFGLARAEGASELTQQGAIVGTPAYMAPEQGAGQTVDARADLFSLGCVLYRMATGTLPFKGKDTVSTLMAVATENPPEPCKLNKELSQPLSDLILQLLAKDPAQRPPTARHVANMLHTLGGGSTGPIPAFKSTRPRRRGLYLAASGMAALLVGVILMVVFWGKSPAVVDPTPDDSDPFEQWRKQIPMDELRIAGGGDPGSAPPTLVRVLGATQSVKGPRFHALSFGGDGENLTAIDHLGQVTRWNVRDGSVLKSVKKSIPEISGAALSPDGTAILYLQGVSVKSWNLMEGTGEELATLPLKKGLRPEAYCLSSRYYLVSNQVFDLQKKQAVCALAKRPPNSKVVLSSDELLLVGRISTGIAFYDFELAVKEGIAKAPLFTLIDTGRPNDLQLSGDGRFLAVAAPRPAEVNVPPESLCPVDGFDLGNDRSHFQLFGHTGILEAVAFRPKTHLLASCGRDRRVIYWDMMARKKLAEVTIGPTEAVLSHLAFSPDGKLLAVANDFGSIYLLRVPDFEQ